MTEKSNSTPASPSLRLLHRVDDTRFDVAVVDCHLRDCTDGEIVDIVEGSGKCAGMAGHIVVRCGRRDVSVGTGMDEATRRSLLADRSQLIGKVAEVDFQMRTPKGSLRHPVFVRVRGDK